MIIQTKVHDFSENLTKLSSLEQIDQQLFTSKTFLIVFGLVFLSLANELQCPKIGRQYRSLGCKAYSPFNWKKLFEDRDLYTFYSLLGIIRIYTSQRGMRKNIGVFQLAGQEDVIFQSQRHGVRGTDPGHMYK